VDIHSVCSPRPATIARLFLPSKCSLPTTPQALAALATLDAAPGVPRFDDDVVRRIPEVHDDKLCDVGAEEVGGAGRSALVIDSRDALRVGDLLDAAGDLRVTPPVRWVF
jgi:hypothetical protein